jgi:hypothetical protein
LNKIKKGNDMNTKQISMVAVMALVLVTAAVSPSLASAQQIAGGKFTLPCTTYWGNAVLPAGNYNFTISHPGNMKGIVAVRISGQKSADLTAFVDYDDYLKESALDVRRSGGSEVVSNLHVADGGTKVSMHFQAAPAAKELLASASTQVAVEKIIVTAD